MFDLVLNMHFICYANQLTGFDTNFYTNFFSKQAIEIWILIPIIPIVYSKKIYTKYDKGCTFEKIHTKIIILKRNLELNDLGFLYYSAKTCPDLSGFI